MGDLGNDVSSNSEAGQAGRGGAVSEHQPIINAPGIILVLIGLMTAIHAVRQIIDIESDFEILRYFAFSPARYLSTYAAEFRGGGAAQIYSFATHVFLHANWVHLIVNSAWLLIFGSLLARRWPVGRFLVFCLICGIAGAGMNLVIYFGTPSLMIGASGAISGLMAAGIRLIYSGSLGLAGLRRRDIHLAPALTIRQTLTQRGPLTFMAALIAIAVLFAVTSFDGGSGGGRIAWDAHLGGFLAGLLLFGLFDIKKHYLYS